VGENFKLAMLTQGAHGLINNIVDLPKIVCQQRLLQTKVEFAQISVGNNLNRSNDTKFTASKKKARDWVNLANGQSCQSRHINLLGYFERQQRAGRLSEASVSFWELV
jgi:hypothetical protein